MALFRLCLVLSSIMVTWCQSTHLVLLSTMGHKETDLYAVGLEETFKD